MPGPTARQRNGAARPQFRPLDHRRRGHQPVRKSPARGSGFPAGLHQSHRFRGHAESDRRNASHRRGTRHSRARTCIFTANRPARAANSATSPCAPTLSRSCQTSLARPAAVLSQPDFCLDSHSNLALPDHSPKPAVSATPFGLHAPTGCRPSRRDARIHGFHAPPNITTPPRRIPWRTSAEEAQQQSRQDQELPGRRAGRRWRAGVAFTPGSRQA